MNNTFCHLPRLVIRNYKSLERLGSKLEEWASLTPTSPSSPVLGYTMATGGNKGVYLKGVRCLYIPFAIQRKRGNEEGGISMAFFMVTSKYPFSASDDVTKVYIKVMGNPTPDYIKRNEIWIATGEDDGLKGYNLFECEDEHLSECLLHVATNLAEFRVVTGYTYNIEILATPEEAVGMLGIKL